MSTQDQARQGVARPLVALALVTFLCALGLAYGADAAPTTAADAAAVVSPDADKAAALWGYITAFATAIGAILGGVVRLIAIWKPDAGLLVWLGRLARFLADIGTKTPITPPAPPKP